ncbi:MAG TPA: hypothetical protein VM759_10970, partial [Longimicrobium sp.]|nr:hypothetical protein [Longimicrobium sp.]
LLVDLMDDSGPTNLHLAWPFSGERSYSIWPVFPKVPVAGDGIVDKALNALRPPALTSLLLQTLMAAVVFAALLLMAAAIRRHRPRPASEAAA